MGNPGRTRPEWAKTRQRCRYPVLHWSLNMKTTRRQFFGKFGIGIAALVSGFLVADKAQSKSEWIEVHHPAEVNLPYVPECHVFGEDADAQAYAKARIREIGKQCPGGKGIIRQYVKISGDYQNLGFIAEKMST
jgi:hypothetical protein